ncbi:MAG TPA: type IV secretion system protein, partial [Streptosporangiaceae bacterium]|nr:type IV secretion system protein [Streptosporangiaceae bacterium]
MRRIRGSRHFPHRTMLVLAVLAVAPGLPQAGHHAVAAPPAVSVSSARLQGALEAPPSLVARSFVAPSSVQAAPRPSASLSAAVPVSAARASAPPVTAVTTAARQPAAPGGLCGVPGIGDIANLFGFCQGGGGVTGDLNNICQPSVPNPEQANSGIDALVKPPAAAGRAGGQAQPSTLYGSYGVAGQYWAATNLQCSDMTSLIGNNVASMVFDIAKSIDRVTITVYQSAAGDGILTWLTSVVDKLISSLGNAIYFPYLAAVVILGAIWLAWQGLIRKRGSRTIEGTIWMVVACAAAIWLIGRPADFTGAGSAVSNGISQTLNVAFAKLPAPSQSNCLPVSRTDPQVQPGTFDSSGNAVVDQNANELWTVLVCKPWLAGEFGTTAFGPTGASTPVNTYGRQLLWAQAIATNEQPTTALVKAKQATYQGIANSIAQRDPGIYALFQGKQWTTRLELAFAALFAAAVAGILVLLIAVTLILLKLGFLLLLVVGPFFLLIGTHPGFGRVVAMRWFEMLVGVLLKQGAVALVLSVLLYAYSLIMGTSDAALPWALKILMIALVTIAVFIYRRPFQHLFSAVGYGMIGSRERAEIDLERSRATLRANTAGAAAAAAGGFAAYRAARWARRNPARAASLAGSGVGSASAAGTTVPAAMDGTSLDGEDGHALANGTGAGGVPERGGRAGARAGLASRARAWAAASAG